MEIESTIKKICNLEIQGAENIAIAGVLCFKDAMGELREDKDTLNRLFTLRKKLLSARPTEPCMRNALDYLFYDLAGGDVKGQIYNRTNYVLEHFKSGQQIIAEIGSQKIKNGMVVFTHCHSSTVMNILKKAKDQGKKFEVYNTETRPMWQGRITAKELSLDNAGLYTLKDRTIAINLIDEKESDINGKEITKNEQTEFETGKFKEKIPFELTDYFIIIGLIILFIELAYVKVRGDF